MYQPKTHASFVISRLALFCISVSAFSGNVDLVLAVGLNYVDADDFTNLTPASAIDSFGSMAEPDNLWDVRQDFGLGFTVFQAAGEDAPQLTQKVTGLVPNKSYDVYGVFVTDDDENWTLRAGLPGQDVTAYSFWGNRGPVPTPDTTQGITAGAAVWDTLPPPNKESTFFTERPADTLVLLLGKAGTTTANELGEIDVLLDDLPNVEPNTGPRRTWLEGVAYTDAGTQIALTATLDRTTGGITITNPTTTPFPFKSYSIVSATGGLDATAWTTIAGWDTTATPSLTSEFASDLTQTDPAMTGTTIAANGGTLSFGSVRQVTPFPENILIRLTRTDDEIAVIAPQYTGPVVNITVGDFDAGGTINLGDFQTLLTNLHTNVSALSLAGAHDLGDMNSDRMLNFDDFVAFRAAFDAANGEGAFEAMLAQVPEPSTLMMLLAMVALCAGARRGAGRLSGFLMASWLMMGAMGSAFAIDIKVDIDSMRTSGAATAGPIATQSGFTSWDLTNLGTSGSTIRVEGVTFEVFGLNAANQSRVRLTDGVPNGGGGEQNDLLADFVFNESADGRAIGLRITGLPVGEYDMQSWHHDFGVTAAEATQVEIRNQGEPSEVVVSGVPWSDLPIEFMFDVTTPGQVREVIFRESSAGNRARLNAFTLFSEVPPPPVIELTLQVNTTSGAVRIVNEQSVSFDMSYYEIRSSAGSLNPAGWVSLDDAEGGDALGEGWDEAAASNANILSEVNLQSMQTFDPGNMVSLGNAFLTSGAEDLEFFYAGPDETILRVGIVEFVTGPGGLLGDYNGDNVVDAADYVVWRKTDGTAAGYNTWRTNFGRTAGAGAGLSAGAAVPEPHAALLLAIGVALLSCGVRRPAV